MKATILNSVQAATNTASGLVQGPLLPNRDHQPVEVSGNDQSDLATRHGKQGAVLVGQQDRAPTGTDRGAGAGCDINTINIDGQRMLLTVPKKSVAEAPKVKP
jgi:hypothetical protein